MALVCVTPPPLEPVSLAELKKYCRVDIDDTSQDDVISALAVAARNWAETFTERRIVQQTWSLYMDFFPGYIDLKMAGQKVSSPFVSGSNAVLVGIRYAIVLPFPPAQSILLFQYQDANGDVTAMTPVTPDDPNGTYVADLFSNPARLTPPFGAMWPVARVVPNAVQVNFRCGYAMPLAVQTGGSGGATITSVATGSYGAYTFQASDVNRPISIPGAGLDGGTFNTVIAAISSPPDVNAVLRDTPPASFIVTTALLVNAANSNPAHWEMFRTGIKMLTEYWFEKRVPDEADIPKAVKMILYPARDLRF